MLHSSRINAKASEVPHTLRLSDIPIPTYCKYLGVKLDYRCAVEKGRRKSPNMPSIDRIDPKKGYIRGNIQVISDLANRMKTDATPEQMVTFALAVLRLHGTEVSRPLQLDTPLFPDEG